jgi:hypothetical protein
MPRYEFMCDKCGELLELTVGTAELAKVRVISSSRKGRRVTQRLRTRRPKKS